MRVSDQIQIKDAFSGRPLRAGEALLITLLNMVQKFYQEKGQWDLKEEESEFFIGSHQAFALLKPGDKPAIIAKRGTVQFKGSGGAGSLRMQKRKEGTKIYMDQVDSIVVFNCIDVDPLRSEDIGLELFDLFGYIKPMLRYAGIQNFTGPTLQDTKQLKGSVRPGHYTTPLVVSGIMQVTWSVTPEAPELKNIITRSNIK